MAINHPTSTPVLLLFICGRNQFDIYIALGFELDRVYRGFEFLSPSSSITIWALLLRGSDPNFTFRPFTSETTAQFGADSFILLSALYRSYTTNEERSPGTRGAIVNFTSSALSASSTLHERTFTLHPKLELWVLRLVVRTDHNFPLHIDGPILVVPLLKRKLLFLKGPLPLGLPVPESVPLDLHLLLFDLLGLETAGLETVLLDFLVASIFKIIGLKGLFLVGIFSGAVLFDSNALPRPGDLEALCDDRVRRFLHHLRRLRFQLLLLLHLVVLVYHYYLLLFPLVAGPLFLLLLLQHPLFLVLRGHRHDPGRQVRLMH